jgi:hypothetical protein
MKIGLIGNMNNNNFSILRYFHDLGADAHLLLNTNDGVGSLSHFRPECDTWTIEKWKPFIHQTEITNAPIAAVEAPLSWAVASWALLNHFLGRQSGYVLPVSEASDTLP